MEFAVSLLALSPLLVGLLEVGRMVEVQQVLDNAAREGGRQASTGRITSAQVQQVVLAYLQNAALTTTNAKVTVLNLTNTNADSTNPPNTDPTIATQLDQLQVNITIPFADVYWVSLHLVSTPTTKMNSQSNWVSVKDKPFPTPYQPPDGH